jgi:formylglycine-generating enzyme required for sulfatase activity
MPLLLKKQKHTAKFFREKLNDSWDEATKICAVLSTLTGRTYRLPSETEWEYACRAGTTTPFHFGETITTDLANYDGTDDKENRWSGSYGKGPKGIYRRQTTPVGIFPPNAFGLYDMYGNVWEWCQDTWHNNYNGAPNDGSAWIDGNDNHLMRGGSWLDFPKNCRSAYRNRSRSMINYVGFRVVCEATKAS